jgi:hypothetical protein
MRCAVTGAVVFGAALFSISCGSSSAPHTSPVGRGDSGSEGGLSSVDDAAAESVDVADVSAFDLTAESVLPDATSPADTFDVDHELCRMSCDVVSAIPCGDRSPTCVQTCETLIAVDLCATETRALRVCLIAAGPTALVCVNPPGQTILMSAFCQQETAASRACRQGDAGT